MAADPTSLRRACENNATQRTCNHSEHWDRMRLNADQTLKVNGLLMGDFAQATETKLFGQVRISR